MRADTDASAACHTHSPKAGQGMNVSMMDSYNLSWKLIHSIHGLTPAEVEGATDPVLASFEKERLGVARQLIEFDSKFSSMFSGQIKASSPSAGESLAHEEFLKVFSDGSGFTSGCGIEYSDGLLVKHQTEPSKGPVIRHDPINGTLTPGRRLRNVRVTRYADANMRNLQDGESPPSNFNLL
jgi:phenol 2-monooxygenase